MYYIFAWSTVHSTQLYFTISKVFPAIAMNIHKQSLKVQVKPVIHQTTSSTQACAVCKYAPDAEVQK